MLLTLKRILTKGSRERDERCKYWYCLCRRWGESDGRVYVLCPCLSIFYTACSLKKTIWYDSASAPATLQFIQIDGASDDAQ